MIFFSDKWSVKSSNIGCINNARKINWKNIWEIQGQVWIQIWSLIVFFIKLNLLLWPTPGTGILTPARGENLRCWSLRVKINYERELVWLSAADSSVERARELEIGAKNWILVWSIITVTISLQINYLCFLPHSYNNFQLKYHYMCKKKNENYKNHWSLAQNIHRLNRLKQKNGNFRNLQRVKGKIISTQIYS